MQREPFNPNLIRVPESTTPAAGSGPISVSQLTTLIKHAIQDALPPTVHVVGEISNYKRHASGHVYFTLKDGGSEVACVMWRSEAAKLKFAPADGLEVVATGGVEVFERTGRYQLYVRRLEPRGTGALELAFRQLRDKLAAEELFDPGRKRPLPLLPRRIALVTSPTGAAVADMLQCLARRCPCMHVLFYPVRVQGPGAALEIAGAIQSINGNAARLGGIDVMIVGRGGGSLEDLWAFNEERVARAIHASAIPIISAVGHETDVTIADLVADVRAATPTAAAELAVPVLDELLDALNGMAQRMERVLDHRVRFLAARLEGVHGRAVLRDPLNLVRRREQLLDELQRRAAERLTLRVRRTARRVEQLADGVERIAPHAYLMRKSGAMRDAAERLQWAMSRRMQRAERAALVGAQRLRAVSPEHRVARWRQLVEQQHTTLEKAVRHHGTVIRARLERQAALLSALSYRSVLSRGFSITRLRKGKAVVRSAGAVHDGDRLVTEVADGTFESEAVNVRQLALFENNETS